MTLKALLIAAVLALAIPAAASAEDPPHYNFENYCGRPFTDIWHSDRTNHDWVGMWTGTDVARGQPSDGVWRLYAAAVNFEDGGGWHFSYYYWASCYY